MQSFLERIESTRSTWQRCFPAVHKPGPKLGRRTPKHKEGLSGSALVEEMMFRLKEFYRSGKPDAIDVVLLIDDADCRFDGADLTFDIWLNQLETVVRTATANPTIPFVVLLASPEIESWLVADWEMGFGLEYSRLETGERPLRRHVEELLGGSMDNLESFGGGLVNGSCSNKLSERLQEFVAGLGGRYSKSTDGASMLRRIRPERVGEGCPAYFRPQWQHLLRAIGATTSNADSTL